MNHDKQVSTGLGEGGVQNVHVAGEGVVKYPCMVHPDRRRDGHFYGQTDRQIDTTGNISLPQTIYADGNYYNGKLFCGRYVTLMRGLSRTTPAFVCW